MRPHKRIAMVSLGIAGLLFLFDCTSMVGGGSGTEVGCVVSGRITDAKGIPASNTLIRLRPHDYLASGSTGNDTLPASDKVRIADGMTGPDGGFSFDSIAIGKYCLEANRGDSQAILLPCEVLSPENYLAIPPAALQPAGTIVGNVKIAENDSMILKGLVVEIRIVGLERLVHPDASGQFKLTVPPHSYYLRYNSDTTDFEVSYVPVSVAPAEHKKINNHFIHHQTSPFPPCTDFACDSAMVRMVLDSAGLPNAAVASVTEVDSGRIVALKLQGLGIRRLAVGLTSLSALRKLDVSDNMLTKPPRYLRSLRKLNSLLFAHNRLDMLPRDIGSLRQIGRLDVSYNELRGLPLNITRIHPTELNLANNHLRHLPFEIAAWADLYDPDWKDTQDGSMRGGVPDSNGIQNRDSMGPGDAAGEPR